MNRLFETRLTVIIISITLALPSALTAGLLYLSCFQTTEFDEPIPLFGASDSIYGNVNSNDYFYFDSPANIFGYISTSQERFLFGRGMTLDSLNLQHEPIFNMHPILLWPRTAEGLRANAHWIDDGGGRYMTRVWMRGAAGIVTYQYELGAEPPPLYGMAVDELQNVQRFQPPAWGAIFIDGQAEVYGEVYGNLTIGTAGNMWLVDDVWYGGARREDGWFIEGGMPHSLGLVSESNIIIKDNWYNGRENGYGEYDADQIDHHSITITAALAAMNQSLKFEHTNEDWEAYQGPSPDERGIIHLRGSLVQRRAAPLHNDNHGGTGYTLDLHYDERFDHRPPPFFDFVVPMYIGGQYGILYIDYSVIVIEDVDCRGLTAGGWWGTEIRFNSNYDLIVRGCINMNGRVESPITVGWIRHYRGGEPARFVADMGGYLPQVKLKNVNFEAGVEVDFNADTILVDSCSFVEDVTLRGSYVEIANSRFGGDVVLDGWGDLTFRRNLVQGGVTVGSNPRSCRLINNTIVNRAGDGVFLDSYHYAELNSNIIAFCRRGVVDDNWHELALLYNDVYDNDEGDYIDCEPGVGSLSVDPMFEDTLRDNYMLTCNSRCIDAGDPDLPPDPDGTRADMGAFWLHRLKVEDGRIIPDDTDLVASPNPFNDAVRIGFKVEKAGEVRLELFDIQGRKILSEAESFPSGSGDYVIDGDRLGGAGVYLLRIGMNGGWRTLKLIYMP